MDPEDVMEGVVDLSFEAFNDLDNLPSAAGRGWLAADLSEDDWTVPLGPARARKFTMLAAMKRQPLPHCCGDRNNSTFPS